MKRYFDKHTTLIVPVIINTVIFLSLSILHFYWSFGGTHWYEDVLPTNSKETIRLSPGTVAGLVIAFGLLLFAFVTIGNQGVFDKNVHRKYFRYGALAIAIVFFLRAIGDLRFVGFFKTVNKTRFGINDTLIFSPLCLFIATLSLFIFIINRNKPKG